MKMNKQSFLQLVNKVISGKATEEELRLFNEYYNHFQKTGEVKSESDAGKLSETEKILFHRISQSIGFSKSPARVIPLYRKTWVRAAAAVILATGIFFLMQQNNHPKQLTANQTHPDNSNIAPGGNKAILTLSNGSVIELDSAVNGTIAKQQNLRVVKLSSGQLAYQAEDGEADAITAMNVLSTPPGGQYQLTLSDGTVVWLNSSSSLRFPAVFKGSERRVELTGEAYFEVVKNGKMPFKVKVNDMEATDLGTHFNIMAYTDEEAVKTSLLEGSVMVQSDKASAILKPGQQSQLKKGVFNVVNHANLEEAVAWKSNLFYFNGADIKSVMRQLSRWYNVEVEYHGQIDQHFTGKISRNADVSTVLKMLELTERVHFKIEGRKIVVL